VTSVMAELLAELVALGFRDLAGPDACAHCRFG
jgi:hypothetical protein